MTENQIAVLEKPRLPHHPAIEERFGVDKSQWKALVEAIYPAAESVDSVVLALSYCKARNLDPMKKPVHIVPVWDSKRSRMVETVWEGIGSLRTTATRTGAYAGKDKTAFGDKITETLGGVAMTYPEWAQVTVYKIVGGQRVAFEGPVVYWKESYSTAKKDTTAPNTMWKKRPYGQIEKCAEAAALRAAFPEEIGETYTAEEMEGKPVADSGVIIDHEEPATVTESVKGKLSRKRAAKADAEIIDVEAEEREAIEGDGVVVPDIF